MAAASKPCRPSESTNPVMSSTCLARSVRPGVIGAAGGLAAGFFFVRRATARDAGRFFEAETAVYCADLVAVGWGNPNGIAPEVYDRRVAEVLALLRSSRPHQVGPPTRAGYPRHALLWNGGCEAVRLAKSVSV